MVNKTFRPVSIVLIALGIVFAGLDAQCMDLAFDKYSYTMNYPRDCPVIEELGGMDKLIAQGQYFSTFGSMLLASLAEHSVSELSSFRSLANQLLVRRTSNSSTSGL